MMFYKRDLILEEDGKINIKATCAKFKKKLEKYIKELNVEQNVIQSALLDIYSGRESKSILLSALVIFTSIKLNAQPENMTVIQGKVKDFIKSHPDIFRITRRGVFLR